MQIIFWGEWGSNVGLGFFSHCNRLSFLHPHTVFLSPSFLLFLMTFFSSLTPFFKNHLFVFWKLVFKCKTRYYFPNSLIFFWWGGDLFTFHFYFWCWLWECSLPLFIFTPYTFISLFLSFSFIFLLFFLQFWFYFHVFLAFYLF